jgi:hypothetical protein
VALVSEKLHACDPGLDADLKCCSIGIAVDGTAVVHGTIFGARPAGQFRSFVQAVSDRQTGLNTAKLSHVV